VSLSLTLSFIVGPISTGRLAPCPFARSSGNQLDRICILYYLLILFLELDLHLPSVGSRRSCETSFRDIIYLLFLLPCIFLGRWPNVLDSFGGSNISFKLKLHLELIFNVEQTLLSQVREVLI